jgi:hypothetical protein
LQIGKKRLSADLGAERLISAEKGIPKIVVEVKSFFEQSDVKDLEQALGQYVLYRQILVGNGYRANSLSCRFSSYLQQRIYHRIRKSSAKEPNY